MSDRFAQVEEQMATLTKITRSLEAVAEAATPLAKGRISLALCHIETAIDLLGKHDAGRGDMLAHV